ncbi:MAG: TIGR02147 family protein [Fibrobacter sp.]|nr:TIGR02147 family protein [Fibrobacter sp.]
MRSIFEYIDYRKFLSEYYQYKKSTSRAFSYRYFCAKAGLTSPVFLKLVIDGKRNLSRQSIEKFCTAMQLTKKQSAFFRNLVLFDQAKTSAEKQEYYAVLRSMENSVTEKILSMDQYDYFSKWYNAVIRELVVLYDFKQNYSFLARCVYPQITEGEAKEAVELLEKLCLIRKKKNGRGYEHADSAITNSGEIGLMAVRQFNRAMIEHSLKAIENIPVDKRHVSGLTIGISPQMYQIVQAEIVAFKDRIVTLINRDEKSSCVYQLNIQLFPVSDDIGRFANESGS